MLGDTQSPVVVKVFPPTQSDIPHIRFTYPPDVFGLLVGEVLKDYTPAQREAFRAGLLEAFADILPPQ